MKKLAAVALLAALALGSACSSGSSKAPSPSNTTATTEPSTQVGPSQSLCDSTSSDLGSLFTQYASLIGQITTQAEVNAALTTGHQLVSAGRTFVATCGHYYNASKIQDINNNLDTVDSSLNSIS